MSGKPSIHLWLILILTTLFTTTAIAAPRALLVTTSAGFEHDVVKTPAGGGLSFVEAQLTAALAGRIDLVTTKDPADINANNLNSFDAVIFYTTGELPLSDLQKSSLLNFVEKGGGFVGVHSATDTLHTWPGYGQLIGARFNGHPWHEPVAIDIAAVDHPATKNLDNPWLVTDEIYQFKDFIDDKTTVLMTLDLKTVDPSLGAHAGPYPLAWARTYGQGKVFYTALGHEQALWSDEHYLAHVAAGIESTISAKQGTAIPLPSAVWAAAGMLAVIAVVQWRARWRHSH